MAWLSHGCSRGRGHSLLSRDRLETTVSAPLEPCLACQWLLEWKGWQRDPPWGRASGAGGDTPPNRRAVLDSGLDEEAKTCLSSLGRGCISGCQPMAGGILSCCRERSPK